MVVGEALPLLVDALELFYRNEKRDGNDCLRYATTRTTQHTLFRSSDDAVLRHQIYLTGVSKAVEKTFCAHVRRELAFFWSSKRVDAERCAVILR